MKFGMGIETEFVRDICQSTPSRRAVLQRQIRKRYLAVSHEQASKVIGVSPVSHKESSVEVALTLWYELGIERCLGTYEVNESPQIPHVSPAGRGCIARELEFAVHVAQRSAHFRDHCVLGFCELHLRFLCMKIKMIRAEVTTGQVTTVCKSSRVEVEL